MNLSKIHDFFKPEDIKGRVHIIGCGSVGSTIAENLARCGVKDFTLWDFDFVEAKNIVNQMFFAPQVGKKKTEALKEILVAINPELEDTVRLEEGWTGKLLSGYVFLAVDSVEIRKQFVEKHYNSPNIKAIFDVRTALTSAQHYAADWRYVNQRKYLMDTMQFTHEEAAAEAPVSACGITLGVATTVRNISAIAVDNFINMINGKPLFKFVEFDGFEGLYDAYRHK